MKVNKRSQRVQNYQREIRKRRDKKKISVRMKEIMVRSKRIWKEVQRDQKEDFWKEGQ